MILFACAVAEELAFLTPSARYDVLATGIGPIEAACAISAALARGTYDLVVNAGIAGGFEGRAAIGEGIVVDNDYLAELGTEDGEALRDGSELITRARSDEQLVGALRARGHRDGNAVTVARVTRTAATAAALARRYDATIESMEGFAVLRAAQVAGVRAIELRGISNVVGPQQPGGFAFEAARSALGPLVASLMEIVNAQ